MKVSREQFAENRERILDVAGTLFREKGFDGIGIADIMKAAGMTHGGFYRHFESKDDLIDQASQKALMRLLQMYLSEAHRDASGRGCSIAALGTDAARQNSAVRKTFEHGMQLLVDKLTTLLPGRTRAVRRRKALASFSQMMGALVLSRAVDDPALSKEILSAAMFELSTAHGIA